MPTSSNDTSSKDIEQAYRDAIDAMTPAERFARSAAMAVWARQQIGRQIVAQREAAGETEPLDPYVLKLLVGLRVYQNDSMVCEWIEQRLADVSS